MTNKMYRVVDKRDGYQWTKAFADRDKVESETYLDSTIEEVDVTGLFDPHMMKAKSLLSLLEEEQEHLRNYQYYTKAEQAETFGYDIDQIREEKQAYLEAKAQIKAYLKALMAE